MLSYLAAIVIGYLLGSFPSGYLVGRLRGVDVRQWGSGRIGGANVLRSVGPWAALLAVMGDVAKGVVAVFVARALVGSPSAEALAGLAAILGHDFSIFLSFSGGRGVATTMGALGALYLPAPIILAVIGLSVIAVSRYSSLGSLTIATLMPFVMLYLVLFADKPAWYLVYGLAAGILIVVLHKGNIQRLLAGTERKVGKSGKRRESVP
ncbi:MAG: glycerol-3-phosphate 1-O-acyltransferase PlsY [Anaerolineales bacterium]|nr:MAG: glycerol-3-phosphate 1-O-acyltransferase PlsY [Anaerolineales bacterium]